MHYKILLSLFAILTGLHVSSQVPVSSGLYHFSVLTQKEPQKEFFYHLKRLGTNDSGYQRVRCTLIDIGGEQAELPIRSSVGIQELMLLQCQLDLFYDARGNVVKYTGADEQLGDKTDAWELIERVKAGFSHSAVYYIKDRGALLFQGLSRLDAGETQGVWWNGDSSVCYTFGMVPPDSAVYPKKETWAELKMKMSYFSDALKKGTEYDSAKVFGFFKQHDQEYRNDRGYQIGKLDIIQATRTAAGYEIYQKQLATVPIAWLDGSYSHLHNKLQDLVDTNPDSSYAVIRYLKKSSSYPQWVQHSFSQAFKWGASEADFKRDMLSRGISEKEILARMPQMKEKWEKATILLSRLKEDGDTVIRDAVYPLWLWQQAKVHPEDTILLHDIAEKLQQLSAGQSVRGNAQRYALLIYQQLRQTGDLEGARRLLDHSIGCLEAEAGDSVNASRMLARNLLAYAWNLKYRETQDSNPQEALQYLAKAAAYSPGSKADKAYGSFYDRLFLGSKESYRPDYTAALLALGNEREAMQQLTRYGNANPAGIKEVKKIFDAAFPGKNFNDFVEEVWIRSWAAAPDFSLKDLDGKVRRLADYKGKWLLLDFWGTWCGPCVREMPEINAFVKRLPENPDLAFLSVACRDEEKSVRLFLQSNGYRLPTVMSDQQIEKQYGVRGYPSKYIVSPEGRMLAIPFGSGWREILDQFSRLSRRDQKLPARTDILLN